MFRKRTAEAVSVAATERMVLEDAMVSGEHNIEIWKALKLWRM